MASMPPKNNSITDLQRMGPVCQVDFGMGTAVPHDVGLAFRKSQVELGTEQLGFRGD